MISQLHDDIDEGKGFVRVGILLLVMMNLVAVENNGRVLRDVHSVVHKVLSGIVWLPHPERRVRALDLSDSRETGNRTSAF